MNISPISFNGIPTGPKPLSKTVKKTELAGLPIERYKTQSKIALEKEMEYCRELLKENPTNEVFRTIYNECVARLKAFKK